MPQGSDDRKHWSREAIERYLNGQMPAEERHALERAALDDHFLADAIEGLRQRVASERKTDLDALSKKLAERTDDKVRRIGAPSKWWWAAASLLILVGGTWYWQSGREIEEPKIAEVIKKDTVVSPPDTIIAQAEKVTSEETPLTLTDTRQPTTDNQHPTTDTRQSTPDTRQPTPDTKADDLSVARSEAPPEAKAKAVIAPSAAPQHLADANLEQDRSSIHIFRGRVVDDKGNGVPFVNISMKGGGAPTYTDAKGVFKVMAMDSAVSLSAHAVGYMDVRSDLRASQPDALIILKPATSALSEVVVTGYAGKERKKKVDTKAVSARVADDEEEDEAEPLDGWAKYEHYLNNNSRQTSPTIDQPSAEVEISFLVSSSGTPYDLKVEHSTCAPCEKEAIRLLHEGPKWESAKPGKKPMRGYITMQF